MPSFTPEPQTKYSLNISERRHTITHPCAFIGRTKENLNKKAGHALLPKHNDSLIFFGYEHLK